MSSVCNELEESLKKEMVWNAANIYLISWLLSGNNESTFILMGGDKQPFTPTVRNFWQNYYSFLQKFNSIRCFSSDWTQDLFAL